MKHIHHTERMSIVRDRNAFDLLVVFLLYYLCLRFDWNVLFSALFVQWKDL